MTKRLESLLSTVRGHRVFIQTHNFPDPDAISSAMGVQKLLELFDISSTICYKGAIAKASTFSMVSEFGIEMISVDKLTDMTADDYIITVDSQMNNANIAATNGTVVACIDHHPTVVAYNYLFRDVRICGSCATLVADYFFSNDLPIDENTATALLYGMKMDTEGFSRGLSEIDAEMFRRLFPVGDFERLKVLSTQQMEFADLKSFTSALSSIKIFDGIAFSFINGEASDGLVASVSDFMLSIVEVQFSIVYAYRGNGLKLSVRSSIDSLDAGTIISNALEGIGEGGGHMSMAGGYISFENLEEAEFDLEEEIQNRFINAVYFSRALQNALADPMAGIEENI